MPAPSRALKSIEIDFDSFRHSIEKCRSAGDFDSAALREAYGAHGRLRERYRDEERGLTPCERMALSKGFKHDHFSEGMMHFRHVSEHITRDRTTFTIWTPDNVPIKLPSTESSARAVFSSLCPTLIDVGGQAHRIDHLRWLDEMEKRIAEALHTASLCD